MVLSTIASVVCLASLIIHAGYDHSTSEILAIRRLLRGVQAVFLTNILFNLLFNLKETVRNSRPIKWIVDCLVLVTLLPWIYPHPANPWLPWLEQILYSNKFIYSILAAYSVVSLCYVLFKLIGRRTNPSLLMSGSFLVFIAIGSFLLKLPKSTYGAISYVDSLFVATSAVSITGLTPVDVSATFTPLGILILAVLLQIGALGVMTFTSFFALFFSGSASIYSQLMLKDMVYSKSMNSLLPTLLYILGFTLIIELIGAVMIFSSIHGLLGMSLADELSFSAFHAISAFCNAGFSTLPGGLGNPLVIGNMPFLWVMSAIIVSGSLGFPILVNFRDALRTRFHNLRASIRRRRGLNMIPQPRQIHVYNMNTKIVLTTFGILLVVGAVMFFLLEYNNSLRGMTLWQKVTQSVFNSVTPRSAGFSSLNPAGFMNVTVVMLLFLMWVGGASQSTGGGVKVNTLAAIWLNLKAILKGTPRVTAFRRTIAVGSIRRANAVVALSILSYLAVSITLLLLEPGLPTKALLFEACSALFTVGSSLGVTSQLSGASEILLCVAMFVGRVGLLSLLSGFARQDRGLGVSYPSDNIIIT